MARGRGAPAGPADRRAHREDGPFALGDVVVLVRATTHLAVYERALEERGIATYVLGGRGYWSQQQVADLRAWLAALANPLDALALHSVLASPLGGVSLDALVILAAGARARRRELWRVVEAWPRAASRRSRLSRPPTCERGAELRARCSPPSARRRRASRSRR